MPQSNLRFLVRKPVFLALVASLTLAACEPSPPAASVPPAATTTTETPMPVSGVQPSTPPVVLTELDVTARTAAREHAGVCSFDRIDSATYSPSRPTLVSDPSKVRLLGWIADQASLTRPEVAALRIDDAHATHAWQIMLGGPSLREDVGRHFNAPALAHAGYDFVADLSALPAGAYRLSVVYQRDGKWADCVGPRIQIGG